MKCAGSLTKYLVLTFQVFRKTSMTTRVEKRILSRFLWVRPVAAFSFSIFKIRVIPFLSGESWLER